MACSNPYAPCCCPAPGPCHTQTSACYAPTGPTGPTGPANPSASDSFTVGHVFPTPVAIPATTGLIIPFNAILAGNASSYATGFGVFTAPSKGLYLINVTVGIQATAATTITTSILKNHVAQLSHNLPISGAGSFTQQLSSVVQLSGSEILHIQCLSSVDGRASLATSVYPGCVTSLSITPLSS